MKERLILCVSYGLAMLGILAAFLIGQGAV
jgi:hypothetical protein